MLHSLQLVVVVLVEVLCFFDVILRYGRKGGRRGRGPGWHLAGHGGLQCHMAVATVTPGSRCCSFTPAQHWNPVVLALPNGHAAMQEGPDTA